MVGFISEPSIEEDSNQISKPDSSDPKTSDLSFTDSFLDLESIRDSFLDLDSVREWFGDNPNLEEGEFGKIGKNMEMVKEENFEETPASDPSVTEFEPNADGFKSNVSVPEPVGGELGCIVKVEEDEPKAIEKISSSIKKDTEKFNLAGELEDGNSTSEESDSESSSSSSSSGSSDDDDEEGEEEHKVKAKVKREEGELEEGELDVSGADDDDDILGGLGYEFDDLDDEDDFLGGVKGPIKSINELEVLPPVPAVDVILQPHHSMLPVGVVSSIMSTVVIVEGREQHNPLSEGSILWITINRSPLGFVDEIFGPVKNPYYKVRYNSESEIPSGIDEGTSISFVPEFANHVLNDKNLYQKGYDASGWNDEELLDDEIEFSDDEKEADYKRMQKITKRGMNDHREGKRKNNKKKGQNRDDAWKYKANSTQQTSTAMGQLPLNQSQHNVPSEPSLVGRSGVPPFSVMAQSSGIVPPSNGVLTDWMQNQQPQDAMFSNRFPAQRVPLQSQNYQQQPFSLQTPAMPLPAMMPYQQQLGTSLSMPPNVVIPGGQPNLFAGTAFASWRGIENQNHTIFGMGMQGQQQQNVMQRILASGQAVDGNCNMQPTAGSFETPQNFNMGESSSRGRNQYHRGRGRGRFTGRRGSRH